ncbi:NitT/TauT family transport system ATP-binding protein [Desulfacinum hydrothermale DSM 13146]|uniref:NitT/TauT family transport system ATP-binding protein n=1 Tax=Desulfacinum hydrothermale DSM 13146 TaxID=1121390 RepID=A0A1W1XUN3_9BACT|nr:ABC transporter ATP-binding protein [Desulfacinum hydrothermale]SMC27565.1 NitT/TauT family transport system ATP-binding protein [Desulfacinum hydrothermale DSM 13146]
MSEPAPAQSLPDAPALLRASDLSKRFRPQDPPVLQGMSLAVGRDDTYAVVGPSGCGKSTLLYLLCGLLRPDSGRVTYRGTPVRRPHPEIAVVLQDYGLLPWKTVLDNVALGLKIRGVSRRERTRRAREILVALGLGGTEDRYPPQLSGGEQQRVAIARALVGKPGLLLLDEPFSSLDAITRERLQHHLLDIWTRFRVPYVLVTHSVDEAVFLARRVLVMAGRPATFVQVLENKGFGDPTYRDREAFHAMARTVRRALDRAVGAP